MDQEIALLWRPGRLLLDHEVLPSRSQLRLRAPMDSYRALSILDPPGATVVSTLFIPTPICKKSGTDPLKNLSDLTSTLYFHPFSRERAP